MIDFEKVFANNEYYQITFGNEKISGYGKKSKSGLTLYMWYDDSSCDTWRRSSTKSRTWKCLGCDKHFTATVKKIKLDKERTRILKLKKLK